MADKKYPRVGIGVMIKNGNDEVLLGLRQGSHGTGEWCFPGGHLDFGETVFECAIRETKEEVGIEVRNCRIISIADEMRYVQTDDKHYLNIGVLAEHIGGEPKLLEPEKCKEWRWFSLENIPKNMLEGTNWIIANYKAKRLYRPAR